MHLQFEVKRDDILNKKKLKMNNLKVATVRNNFQANLQTDLQTIV